MGKVRKRPADAAPRSARRRQARLSASPARPRLDWVWPVLTAITLAVLVFAAFWPALSAEFINFDDDLYVSDNSYVRQGLTLPAIIWAWTSHYVGYQIPLTWMSLMLDTDLFGASPAGYHLTNVLLHAAGAVLLFLALRRATRSAWRAALAAALWAIHPLRVESVAWVTERKDVLAGFFGFAALYAYLWYARAPQLGDAVKLFGTGHVAAFIRYARTSGRYRYAVVVGTYSLSLLSKPQLIMTLPLILWLLDYWPLGRMEGGPVAPGGLAADRPPVRSPLALALEKWPLVLVTVVAAAATAYSEYMEGPFLGDVTIGLGARLANAGVAPVRYLGKLFYFQHLAPLYPLSPTWNATAVVGSGALLLAVTILVLWQRRRRPWLAVGWFWFVAALGPGLTPPPGLLGISMADRFTYFPAVGLCLMAVWSIPDAWVRTAPRRAALTATAAVCLVALLGYSRVQADYWHDSATLFRHTVAVTDGNWLAHHDLAKELADRGENAEALGHFEECLRINPNYIRGWENQAILLQRMGRSAEAVACTDRALSLKPDYVQAYLTRALALITLKQDEEVVRTCEAALRLDPGLADAHECMAEALIRLGRREQSIAHFRKALDLNPDYTAARVNLEWALHQAPATAPTSSRAGEAGRGRGSDR